MPNSSLIKKKIKCRLCNSKDLRALFHLCNSPLANNLKNSEKTALKSFFYPLKLDICFKCKHVQLSHVVSSKLLFSNYLYKTGISTNFNNHFKKYSSETLKLFRKTSKNKLKVLEIGSNDCTLLKHFKNNNCKTVGIEPAKNLYQLTKNDHDIFNKFFNRSVANTLKSKYGKFDIIVANNVFAHIDNLEGVFKNLIKILHSNSIIIFEVSYLLEVIKNKLFDTIYHEHLDYHNIKPLIPFLKKFNLKIINVKKVNTHGGSIRIYASQLNSDYKVNNLRLNKYLDIEKKHGLHKISTFIEYKKKLDFEKNMLSEFIKKISNKKTYGYGAAAKAVTLISYYGINKKNITCIIDDSDIKQNKYLPGSGIKIENSKILNSKPCDNVIILAWNLSSDIILKIKKFKKIKNIIVPLPKLKIIKLR